MQVWIVMTYEGCVINNNCIFGRTISLNCLSYKIEFLKVHL